jgi:hypothetical protein
VLFYPEKGWKMLISCTDCEQEQKERIAFLEALKRPKKRHVKQAAVKEETGLRLHKAFSERRAGCEKKLE